MTSKKIFRSTLAAVAAATMTVMATPGVALAADNAPFVSNQDSGWSEQENGFSGEALAKMPLKAELKIHKFTPADKKGPDPDGTQIDTDAELAGAKPIEGVTFTLYKVEGIDLTKNAGWQEATQRVLEAWNKLDRAGKDKAITDKEITWSDGTDSKTYTLTEGSSGKTDAKGLFSSGKVDNGLYVVQETVDGKVKIDGGKEVPGGSIVKAAPFVVTLPMTNPKKRGEWMDTVHVYPKNSETGIVKSVDDEGARGTGNDRVADNGDKKKNIEQSTVTYTIDADIPKSDSFRNFQVLDKFHEKVNYAGTDGTDKADSTTGVWLIKPDGTKTKLVEGTDYTVQMSAGAATPPDGTTNIPEVVITLTDAMLKKLPEYKGGKLQWKLNAVFDKIEQTGELPNDTWVIPDYPSNTPDRPWAPGDNPPDTPNAKVISKYGKMKLTKVNSKDGSVIPGVKFKLWVCDKDANKLPLNGQPESATNPVVPVSVNNEDEFTTDSNGLIELTGLRLNDFKNGSSAKEGLITDPDKMDFYCLEETEAAPNFEKLPKLVQFQIKNDTPSYTKEVKVSNVPSNGGFDLPLTGGNGIFPLVALGGLLVAGSAGYAAFAARRKQAQS